MIKTEIQALTARGVVIRSFESRDLALSWWEQNADEFPGGRVEEVITETRVIRRTLRGRRLQLVGAA